MDTSSRSTPCSARSHEAPRPRICVCRGLDLRGHDEILAGRHDIEGLVVLGGRLSPQLVRRLARKGAVIFPPAPQAPVDPYRSTLNGPGELCEHLTERGYAATPHALAHA